jgi:two-component system sensor histidine kinase KdpD
VTIRVYATGDATIVEVADEGPGIGPSERERVFEMFYRAPRGDRRPGDGLGLAICRSLIAAHGGTVAAVPATAGTGTCMRITLPLASNPAAENSDD